jgi:predicted transposase YdaD
VRGRWAARAIGLAGLAPFDRLHALQAERGVSPCGVSPPLPHLPATYGRECNDHPLSEQVALLIKTFPPQGFSAEWEWLQARAAEDSRIVLIAESLPQEELLALYGVLWPRGHESGTSEQPVVLLEVQMHPKAEFKHRLWAQTARFAQLHPQVQHLEVVVLVLHQPLHLGPDALPRQQQAFLADVHWLSLEELGQRPGLDPLVSLLTLPVQPEAQIQSATQQILGSRPDLFETVVSILMERFPLLTRKDIMEIATIPAKDLRHTRAAQEWIAEGEARGEAKVALRLLGRRCGPLSEATTARIQALPLDQLEALAEALLDFTGPADLAAWLEERKG